MSLRLYSLASRTRGVLLDLLAVFVVILMEVDDGDVVAAAAELDRPRPS